MGVEFADKVVLVTGAASGIGRASAQAFAREGATVVVADIDEDGAQATVDDLVGNGAAALIRCDVSRPDDVQGLVDTIVERHGRLDVAHNNAGIEGDPVPMAEVSLDNWHKVFAVNVTGVFLCMQAEITAMLATGGGAIVNTASVSGLLVHARSRPPGGRRRRDGLDRDTAGRPRGVTGHSAAVVDRSRRRRCSDRLPHSNPETATRAELRDAREQMNGQ